MRGVIEHVAPGGSVCLATASGFVWVSPDDIELGAASLDPALFG